MLQSIAPLVKSKHISLRKRRIETDGGGPCYLKMGSVAHLRNRYLKQHGVSQIVLNHGVPAGVEVPPVRAA